MKSILINGKRWEVLRKRFSIYKNSYIYTLQDESGKKKDVSSLNDPKLFKTVEKADELKGDKGEPGKDGKTPIPGVDFLTKKELDSIVSEVVAEVMSNIRIPKDGIDGVIPKAGVDYPTLKQVREWANKEVSLLAQKLQPTQVKEIKTVVKEIGMTKEEIKDFIKENLPKRDLIGGGGGSFVGLAKVDTQGTPGTLEEKIVAGSNVTITKVNDTLRIASSGGGGGGGTVDSIVAGNNIDVDATDPANPIVSVETLTLADISDVTASVTEVNYIDGVTSAIQTQLNAKAADADVVHDTGDETIAGVKTFSSDPLIPDEAYGAGWNGSLEPATKNALYDKIETLGGGSGITRTIVSTSGSATMGSSASTDYVYFVTGAHTMSLPAAAGNTNRYTVKNNHSANITIDTAGAETVEGAASISIAPQESVDIISNGTNWFVI